VVVDLLGMTGCQSRIMCTALPMTSALRFRPWGPLGIGVLNSPSFDRLNDDIFAVTLKDNIAGFGGFIYEGLNCLCGAQIIGGIGAL